ncbi:phage head-tail connector protein [Collinsella sp. AGMB00827]|uniref:Phage head-tail connector protein n=1 Tax=Collinsella ureilytica TaxID=2869515 RepID=A0ABS7MLW1_9ACTN|nr:phage head-tail connector protein [Collinsella urealyticum]MBY4798348.1 phage head-tail connector protein [Collinsella urealyticum]
MMSREDKVVLALALCGIAESHPDAQLVTTAYLPLAERAIMDARHPFSKDPKSEAWESRFDMLQCEIAADMYNRRGAEGEIAHDENGVNRTWAVSGISRHLLQRIVPKGKVPGNEVS